MLITLPPYCPPNTFRANVAVGVAPVVVLLSFTLLVVRWIEADTLFAVFLACIAWVVYEMHEYQKTIDSYNAEYASKNLVWRTTEALRAMLGLRGLDPDTHAFVQRFLDADRRVLLDGMVA